MSACIPDPIQLKQIPILQRRHEIKPAAPVDEIGRAHVLHDADCFFLCEAAILPGEVVEENGVQEIFYSEMKADDKTSHDLGAEGLEVITTELRIFIIDAKKNFLEFVDLFPETRSVSLKSLACRLLSSLV
jgi:hypothetical protein